MGGALEGEEELQPSKWPRVAEPVPFQVPSKVPPELCRGEQTEHVQVQSETSYGLCFSEVQTRLRGQQFARRRCCHEMPMF